MDKKVKTTNNINNTATGTASGGGGGGGGFMSGLVSSIMGKGNKKPAKNDNITI
jgi:hypothetical protein